MKNLVWTSTRISVVEIKWKVFNCEKNWTFVSATISWTAKMCNNSCSLWTLVLPLHSTVDRLIESFFYSVEIQKINFTLNKIITKVLYYKKHEKPMNPNQTYCRITLQKRAVFYIDNYFKDFPEIFIYMYKLHICLILSVIYTKHIVNNKYEA